MDPELLRQTSGFDYVFGWIWAIALGLTLYLWRVDAEERKALFLLWTAKVLVALVAMLPYESNYGLDAYYYFLSGQYAPLPLSEVHIGNGTEIMILLSTIHDTILPISYHAQKISCAFVGFVAIYQFYRAGRTMWPSITIRSFYVLALAPSILFWSTILGKDPLTLLGVGLYTRGVVEFAILGRIRPLFRSVIGIVIAAVLRTWLAPIFVAPLAVFAVLRMKSLFTKLAFTVLLAGGGVGALAFAAQQNQVASVQEAIDYSNVVSHDWQRGGSGQELDTEFTSVGSIVAFMPLGIVTALFRPLPGELLTPFAFAASLENGVLIFLVLRSVVRLRRRDLMRPLVLWAGAFLFVWSSIYGIISYQNLGTAVRFRLQVMPVLIGIVLYLGRKPGEEWDEEPVSDEDAEDDASEDQSDDEDAPIGTFDSAPRGSASLGRA